MRAAAIAFLLLLAGCSLTIDPEGVPEPAGGCVPTGCAGVLCGQADNCGTVCGPGSGCTAPAHVVEGGLTMGAVEAQPVTGANHRVRGAVTAGAAAPSGSNHRIDQGLLR